MVAASTAELTWSLSFKSNKLAAMPCAPLASVPLARSCRKSAFSLARLPGSPVVRSVAASAAASARSLRSATRLPNATRIASDLARGASPGRAQPSAALEAALARGALRPHRGWTIPTRTATTRTRTLAGAAATAWTPSSRAASPTTTTAPEPAPTASSDATHRTPPPALLSYPHLTPRSELAASGARLGTVEEFRAANDERLAAGQRELSEPAWVLRARVASHLRSSSSKLCFFHVESPAGARVQVLADARLWSPAAGDEFSDVVPHVRVGDVVEVRGPPGKTKTGELVVLARAVTVLAPCIRDLPVGRGDGAYALADAGARHRQREVDLLVGGAPARRVFEARARVVSRLRRFLDERGFLEVETPILSAQAGGASAKPVQTPTRGGLALRVAPELALKRLIVGGFERVYELGRVFRDEGVSARHNPEFTSCELYWAFADMEDLVPMTRELFSALADAAGASRPSCGVDFARAEYPRLSVADVLERKCAGLRFDDPDSLRADALLAHCERLGVSAPAANGGHATARLLDRLVSDVVEPMLDPATPTLLTDHPVAISPLAKEKRGRRGVAERFELFAAGIELCNAYTELNDPAEQRERFRAQAALKAQGDVEAHPPDEGFCRALELGMPPTAGWGCGVDRAVMLLTGKRTIRDAVLFPATYK